MTDEQDKRKALESLVWPKKLGPVEFHTLMLNQPNGRSVTLEVFLKENPNLIPIPEAKEGKPAGSHSMTQEASEVDDDLPQKS